MRCDIDFPNFEQLKLRHKRLSLGTSIFLAEAARVALARHHPPPRTVLKVSCEDGTPSEYVAHWSAPDQFEMASHANTDNATEDGAYCLAIAAVEEKHNLYAVARTERKTGADYWIDAAPEPQDLENSIRLEVSGVDRGSVADVLRRLSEKVEQTRRGSIAGPAIAAAVGFKEAMIVLKGA